MRKRRPKTQLPTKNELLRARIIAYFADVRREESESGARSFVKLWCGGDWLLAYEGSRKEKCQLAGGESWYYRTRRVRKHFASLAEAKAYQGFIRMFEKSLRKCGKETIAPIEEAARALIKRAAGDVAVARVRISSSTIGIRPPPGRGSKGSKRNGTASGQKWKRNTKENKKWNA